jgi:hypothetical protein
MLDSSIKEIYNENITKFIYTVPHIKFNNEEGIDQGGLQRE